MISGVIQEKKKAEEEWKKAEEKTKEAEKKRRRKSGVIPWFLPREAIQSYPWPRLVAWKYWFFLWCD